MPGDEREAPGKADEEYFQRIETRFAQLRGRPLFLSPRDASLVDAWWKAGVPLRLILEAIESVFRRREETGGSHVHSLGYCRHAVEEAFADWTETRLGAREDDTAPPPPDAAQIVDALAGTVRTLVGEAGAEQAAALRGAAEGMEALSARLAGTSPPAADEVERELERIETELLDTLLASMPAEARRDVESSALESLQDLRGRLTGRAWATTLDARIRAAVRQRAAVPRLTLYLG